MERKVAAVDGEGHDYEDVATALEQLRTDKKIPEFIKIFMSHMLSLQKELCGFGKKPRTPGTSGEKKIRYCCFS